MDMETVNETVEKVDQGLEEIEDLAEYQII